MTAPRLYLPKPVQHCIRKPIFGLLHNFPILPSTNVYDEKWDLLIIIDGCRVDAMKVFQNKYDYLENIQSIYSVASASHTWMQRTFSTEYGKLIKNTAYITGNVNSEKYCPPYESFYQLDEVWKYRWSDSHGTVPAGAITDRAVDLGRKENAERILLHYMQPHFPSIPDPLPIQNKIFNEDTESVWEAIEEKKVKRDRVWDSYIKNLNYVLESIELLLNNIDAKKVIISSDHANLFDEWGLYGHPFNIPAPALRRVPWVVCSGSDSGAYEPEVDISERRKDPDNNVEELLRNLGYT